VAAAVVGAAAPGAPLLVPAAAAEGKQVAAAVVGAAAPGAPLLVPAAAADGKQVAVAAVVEAPGARSRGLVPPAVVVEAPGALSRGLAPPAVVAAVVPDALWLAPAPERTSSSAAEVAEVATASPCSAAADRWEAAAAPVSPMPAPDRLVVAAAVSPVLPRHSRAAVQAAAVRPVRNAAVPEVAPWSRGHPVLDGIRPQAVGRVAAHASPRSAMRRAVAVPPALRRELPAAARGIRHHAAAARKPTLPGRPESAGRSARAAAVAAAAPQIHAAAAAGRTTADNGADTTNKPAACRRSRCGAR
jgi:hypothetical protein